MAVDNVNACDRYATRSELTFQSYFTSVCRLCCRNRVLYRSMERLNCDAGDVAAHMRKSQPQSSHNESVASRGSTNDRLLLCAVLSLWPFPLLSSLTQHCSSPTPYPYHSYAFHSPVTHISHCIDHSCSPKEALSLHNLTDCTDECASEL